MELSKRKLRPILWGLIFFVIGAVGWVISVVLTIVSLGALVSLTYIFGTLMIASLPVAIVWEIFLKFRKRKD